MLEGSKFYIKKITHAYLFQIAREKSCDYVLITYMKKHEIIYHNYVEARAGGTERGNRRLGVIDICEFL